MRRELLGDVRRMLGMDEHVSAADVDMRGEADGDGFSGISLLALDPLYKDVIDGARDA